MANAFMKFFKKKMCIFLKSYYSILIDVAGVQQLQ